jgi:phage baseplate assembly protein gpV
MSTSDDLMNAVRREIERQLNGRYNTRVGLVTAYDPNTHSAKVMIKPDNTETGWVPNITSHIGNGFGILSGLTPGDGKATGDQVVVLFQEGDLEQGGIVHRLFSDKEKPPPVQSGEILVKHEKGGSFYFDKNGKITITGGKGQADQNQQNPPPTAISKPAAPGSGLDQSTQDAASGQTIVFDTKGNITHTGLKGQTTVHDPQGNITHTGVKGQTIVVDPNGNITLKGIKGQTIVIDPNGNITETATNNGTHTTTAPQIAHNGPTTITGQTTINGQTSITDILSVTKMINANGGLGGLGGLGNFANDAAAATGGVSIGSVYRNASALLVRVA